MKKRGLTILLVVSLCLNVVLLAILCMSRRSQPLTGTFLCEGSSHSDGTYLTFDEKGSFTGSSTHYSQGHMPQTPTASISWMAPH